MSDITKQVTFTDDVAVHDADGGIEFEAKAGTTMDLLAPSANRWIRRGKAVAGSKAPAAIQKQPEKPAEKPAETMERQAPITQQAKAPAPKKKRATSKKAAPKKQAD